MDNVKSDKEILYIFMHIQKTGGTTFFIHLENNFSEEERLRVYEYYNKDFADIQKVESYFNNLTEEQKSKIKIIYGHDLFYGIHEFFPEKESRYFTFIRDPIRRTISVYNYRRGLPRKTKEQNEFTYRYWQNLYENDKLLSFQDWIKKRVEFHNYMIKFLMKRKFITEKKINEITIKDIDDALSKFFFVGVTKSLTQDSAYLYHLLGIKNFNIDRNISTKFFKFSDIDEKLKSYLKSKNAVDFLLFNRSKIANKKFMEKIPNINMILETVNQRKLRSIKKQKRKESFKKYFIRPITYPFRLARRIGRFILTKK